MAFPATYSFPVYAGDTISFDLTYKEGTKNQEVGKSLTGATIVAEVRTARTAADPGTPTSPTTTMTCTADADQTSNPGKMTVLFPSANTALLTGSLYVYDIEVTWADATVQTILQGELTVTQGVTE